MNKRLIQDKRCPKCQSSIVWSINNFGDGSSSIVRCSKNVNVSRIDWVPEEEMFCDWRGIAVRKNGGVVFYELKTEV